MYSIDYAKLLLLCATLSLKSNSVEEETSLKSCEHLEVFSTIKKCNRWKKSVIYANAHFHAGIEFKTEFSKCALHSDNKLFSIDMNSHEYVISASSQMKFILFYGLMNAYETLEWPFCGYLNSTKQFDSETIDNCTFVWHYSIG